LRSHGRAAQVCFERLEKQFVTQLTAGSHQKLQKAQVCKAMWTSKYIHVKPSCRCRCGRGFFCPKTNDDAGAARSVLKLGDSMPPEESKPAVDRKRAAELKIERARDVEFVSWRQARQSRSLPLTPKPSPRTLQAKSVPSPKSACTFTTSKYKTVLCTHWSKAPGKCPYGGKCQFAHGPKELREEGAAGYAPKERFSRTWREPEPLSPPLTPKTPERLPPGLVPPAKLPTPDSVMSSLSTASPTKPRTIKFSEPLEVPEPTGSLVENSTATTAVLVPSLTAFVMLENMLAAGRMRMFTIGVEGSVVTPSADKRALLVSTVCGESLAAEVVKRVDTLVGYAQCDPALLQVRAMLDWVMNA
jgi:hypothetical protein